MSKKKNQHHGRIYRDEYKKQVSMFEFGSPPILNLKDSDDIRMNHLSQKYEESGPMVGSNHQQMGNSNGYLGRYRTSSEKHSRTQYHGQLGREDMSTKHIGNTNVDLSTPSSIEKMRGDSNIKESKSSLDRIQNINSSNKRGRSGSKDSRQSNKSLRKQEGQKSVNYDIIRGGSNKEHRYRDRSNTEGIVISRKKPITDKVERSVSETELESKKDSSTEIREDYMKQDMVNVNEKISRKFKTDQRRGGTFSQLVQPNSDHEKKKRVVSDKQQVYAPRKSSENTTEKRAPNDNKLIFKNDELYGYDHSNKKSKHDRKRSRQSSGSNKKSRSNIKSDKRTQWTQQFTGFDLDPNDRRYAKFQKNVEQIMGRYNNETIDETGGGIVTKCRQRRCITLLLMTILVLLGVIAALLIVFLFPKESTSSSELHDMLRAHVKLRVLNRHYDIAMSQNDSAEFETVSIPFCNEIDNTFLTSILKNEYYGCDTMTLWDGSIRLYYTSPFLDMPSTSNVTLLREIMRNQHEKHAVIGDIKDTVMIGEFLVDGKSIEISLEKYQTNNLPQKPTFHTPGQLATTVSSEIASTEGLETQHTPIVTHTLMTTTTSDTISTTLPTKVSTTFPMPSTSTDAEVNNYTPAISSKLPTSTVTSSTQTSSRIPNQSNNVTTQTTVSLTNAPSRTTFSQTAVSYTSSQLPTRVTTTTSRLFTSPGNTGHGTDTTVSTPATTTGPPTTDGLQKPGLSILISEEVQLLKEPASITCQVTYIKGIQKVTIYHSAKANPKTLIAELNETDIRSQWTRLAKSVYLNVVKNDSVIYMGVNFTSVTCEMAGNYTCVVNAGEVTLSATGYLHGTAPPGQPHLKLPMALIEDREISITCTANVGFPLGAIRWLIKPKGMSHFIPFDDQILSSSGVCNTYVTSSIIYTPTRDGNGTLLKCLVENDAVAYTGDLTQVSELQILAASLCDGVPTNMTVRHPFTCTLYVRCIGNTYDVIECKNNLCYDVASGQCGHSAISMTSVVAYLNEGVTSLKCRLLHMGTWNHVTVSKVKSDGELKPILTATSDMQTTLYDTEMKDRLFVDIEVKTQYEVVVTFWVYVLACEDHGEYVCETDPSNVASKARGRIELKVKPEAPTITIPNEIIEDFPLRTDFTCRADVGYPYGHLAWTVKSRNESRFYPLTYNVTSEIEDNNCSRVVTISFGFLPTISHNYMEIRCELENTASLPGGHKLVAMETIHVVPGNFCATHVQTVPQVHPYDCHQYVQCAEGYTYVQRCGSKHCFNPETLRCDAAPEIVPEELDPSHPCRPNRNGVYLPHPFLCNKYIWCVQGAELVQHCPMGTLYIDGGQCTFVPNQSRCYKDAW